MTLAPDVCYISTVANLKNNMTSEQKEAVREAFPETFCTYLMERTNSVLNQKLDVCYFYLINTGGEKAFLCYTRAAFLANLLPFQWIAGAGSFRGNFKRYFGEDVNGGTSPNFYHDINSLSNLKEVHWGGSDGGSLGWYDEKKHNQQRKKE